MVAVFARVRIAADFGIRWDWLVTEIAVERGHAGFGAGIGVEIAGDDYPGIRWEVGLDQRFEVRGFAGADAGGAGEQMNAYDVKIVRAWNGNARPRVAAVGLGLHRVHP